MSENRRRLFNRKQRIRLFIAAQGKCMICKKPLTKGWHADHHYPYSKGGLTVLQNGRATCAKCNLEKSDTTPLDFL